MKNKKQDTALQAPSEANRDKHMNYLEAEEQRENAGVTRDEESEGMIKQENLLKKTSSINMTLIVAMTVQQTKCCSRKI